MSQMNEIATPSEQKRGKGWVNCSWIRVLLLTVFTLGVFFRLSGLGNKIYSHDEAYTSLYAAGYVGDDVFDGIWDGRDITVGDIQKFLRPDDEKNIAYVLSRIALYSTHQAPLFFLLEHYWMYIIGYSPAAMRGLAALFGLLSIPAMYWLGKELFQSTGTALLSSALFAISPFHILFAQDARPYSLWTLATLLSSAAFLRAMRKDKNVDWLLYSLTLILGLYSHQLFVLVIIAHGLYFIGIHLVRHKKRYIGFLLAGLLTFVAYAPWLYFVITRWRNVARQVDILSSQISWRQYIQGWVLSFSSPFVDLNLSSGNLIPYLLRALMLLLLAYSVVLMIAKSSAQVWMLPILIYVITAGSLIFADLFLGGMRSITGRYLVPANIATILVVAYSLANGLQNPHLNTSGRWGFLTGILVVISILSNVNSLRAETWWNKDLGRIGPEFIHRLGKDRAVLIVSGSCPTNLGDVLLLGFELDPNVHVQIYEDPNEIKYPDDYQNIYWFPSTKEEVQKISALQRFKVSEVMQGILWRIDGLEK